MKYKCWRCAWLNPWLPCHCFKLGKLLSPEEKWSENDESCEFYKETDRLI